MSEEKDVQQELVDALTKIGQMSEELKMWRKFGDPDELVEIIMVCHALMGLMLPDPKLYAVLEKAVLMTAEERAEITLGIDKISWFNRTIGDMNLGNSPEEENNAS